MAVNVTLKKLFPISYTHTLWRAILLYVLTAVAAGLLIWLATLLTGWIPAVGAIIGWILGIAGAIVELYAVAGIVVSILRKLDILR